VKYRLGSRRNVHGIGILVVILIVAAAVAVTAAGTVVYERTWGESARLRRERDQVNQRTIVLQGERDEVQRQLARVQASLAASRIQYRVATIEVVDQRDSTEYPGKKETTVRYQETDSLGVRMGQPEFVRLLGTRLYVHGQVVRLPEYEPSAPSLGGHSLFLTRGLYTEEYSQNGGYRLNPMGIAPYGSSGSRPGGPTAVNRNDPMELFRNFWNIANNPALARDRGYNVRDAYGQGLYMETELGRNGLELGQRYRLSLRASDALNLEGVETIPRSELDSIRAQIPPNLPIHPLTGTSSDRFSVPPSELLGVTGNPTATNPSFRGPVQPTPRNGPAPVSQNGPAASERVVFGGAHHRTGRPGTTRTNDNTDAISWERDGYISQ
jgi:hypothetical protein